MSLLTFVLSIIGVIVALFIIKIVMDHFEGKKGISETEKESLQEYFNYLDFGSNKIFFEDNSYGIVLRLGQIYRGNMSDEDIAMFKFNVISLLNQLKLDCNYKFVLRKHKNFEREKEEHLSLNQSDDPLANMLFEDRIKQLEKDAEMNNCFKQDYYLIIRKKHDFDIKDFKKLIYNEEKTREELKEMLDNFYNNIVELEDHHLFALKGAGIPFEVPTEEETIATVYSYLNQDVKFSTRFLEKQDLFREKVEVEKDYLKINDKYCSFLTLLNVPQETNPLIFEHMTNINCEFDLSIDIKKVDKQEKINAIERERRHKRALKDEIGGGVKVDKQKAEDELTALLYELNNSSQHAFKYEFKIMLKHEDLRQLRNQRKELKAEINQLNGAIAFEESHNNFKLFIENAFGKVSRFNNFCDFELLTSYVADMLPTYGPPEGLGKALMLFRSKVNSLIKFNPLSEMFNAKNGLVIGATGTGKTFAVIYILLSYFGLDPSIMIVDKGGSFKKFIKLLGGSYFELTNTDKEKIEEVNFGINPFATTSRKKYELWENILGTMVQEGNQAITNNQKIIINRAITDIKDKIINNKYVVQDKNNKEIYYFNKIEEISKDRFEDKNDYEEFKKGFEKYLEQGDKEENEEFEHENFIYSLFNFPIISDFVKAIEDMEFEEKNQMLEQIRNITRMHLEEIWTKGTRGKFLNNRYTDFDVDKRILGIDMDGLDSGANAKLLEIFMLYISDTVWKKTYEDEGEKIFIFDEAWKTLMTDKGATLIKEMFKTLRKFGACIFLLSQSIKDLTSVSDDVKSGILNNIAFAYILGQKNAQEYGYLQEVFGLTDKNIQQVNNLSTVKGEYAEALIFVPDEINFVARVRASDLEYWIATTYDKDKNIYYKALEQFSYDRLSTLEYLSQKCPRGYLTYGQAYDNRLKEMNGDVVKTIDSLYEQHFNQQIA